MKTLAKTLTHALAALGLAGAAVTPALAEAPEKMTVIVNFADLDLGTVAGQKALSWRLEKAARTVCRVTESKTGTRLMSHEAQSCLSKVRLQTRDQVATLTQDQQRGG